MTSRMALGSVSTLAVGAMLLGAMPYLISRTLAPSHGAPWGALSGLTLANQAGAAAETPAPAESDRAQLLKLAALKTSAQAPAAPIPLVQSLAANNINWSGKSPAAAPAVSHLVTASAVPTVPAAPVPETPDTSDSGQTFAALAPPLPPVRPAAPAHVASSAININTASMQTLDAFPGVGRIGHAIMVHRPYRSVSDLVRRRILRFSDFQKIQSRIRVD